MQATIEMFAFRVVAALLLGVAAAPAFASSRLQALGPCPTVDQVDSLIISCGDNHYGADLAQQCTDQVVASWKAVAAQLGPLLQVDPSSQNASELNTTADYQRTIEVLNQQIKYMQAQIALIANYVLPMVDFPESQDLSTSIGCFVRAFNRVQANVSYLDGEIIRAKKIRAMALDLQKTAAARHQNLDGALAGPGAFINGGADPARAASVKGDSRPDLSDVTGHPSDASLASLGSPKSGAGVAQAVVLGGLTLSSFPSTITSSPASASPGKITTRAGAISRNSVAVDPSVGAVLWQEAQDPFNLDLKLAGNVAANSSALQRAAGPTATVGGAMNSLAAAKDEPGGGASAIDANAGEPSDGRLAPGRNFASLAESGQQALALVQEDTSLFVAVSRHYYASALFRTARRSALRGD